MKETCNIVQRSKEVSVLTTSPYVTTASSASASSLPFDTYLQTRETCQWDGGQKPC